MVCGQDDFLRAIPSTSTSIGHGRLIQDFDVATARRGVEIEPAEPPSRLPRHTGDVTREPKTCQSCGRTIEWRKKWERDWDSVRYCSTACRKRGVSDVDRRLESAITDLLGQRAGSATICPSEAARVVGSGDGWRELMEPARRAARRLVDRGEVEIVQGGRVVDPSTAKGPIRIRRV